ncbi:HAMP domain-containing sensor histidine kinase [Cupriavidus sp. CV2]|uniref:sensor histidine kinase n=1 Tax=Cupriavidus ulmosensis TaxID=3065913 RepID=UPI00296B1D5A|nr:HAMP domain-containing sensor histidine kinase [Cupriavidus sp. CV2]MDW3683446.1 HAMP domain-containing sensor histidine kinase [Cupriavidus sp. CV2]
MSQQHNPSGGPDAPGHPAAGESSEPIQSTAEVAALIGQVAHDLRSALNGVQSWAYVLDRSLDTPPTSAQRALSGIRTGMQQQLALIEHMEEAVALLADDSPPQWERVDLLAALQKATDEVRPVADARGVTLAAALVDSPEGQPAAALLIDADPRRLDPLLRHLLVHCIRHARSADTVEAHLKPEVGRIRLRITESRAPTDARKDERIAVLSDFFRRRKAQGGVSAPHQGTALLLARRLVETHGAHIEAEGQGCSTDSGWVCIAVSFPLHEPAHGTP